MNRIEEHNYNDEYIWFNIKYRRIRIAIGYCIGRNRYSTYIRKKKESTISFGEWYFKDTVEKILSIIFGEGLVKPKCQTKKLKKRLYRKWYKYVNKEKNMI